MKLIQLEKTNQESFRALPLYPAKLICLYDIKACYNNLIEEIDRFIDLQCLYFNLIPPKLTQDYKVVYTAYHVTDKIGKNVEKKLDTLEEIKNFYNQIANAFQLLNHEEMVYFSEVIYYKRKSESECAESLNITTYILKQVKESCIIKLTRALNKAVLKKN